MHATYPPDPTVHSDPELARRCPYCHPRADSAAPLPKASTEALSTEALRDTVREAVRRFEVRHPGFSTASSDPLEMVATGGRRAWTGSRGPQ